MSRPPKDYKGAYERLLVRYTQSCEENAELRAERMRMQQQFSALQEHMKDLRSALHALFEQQQARGGKVMCKVCGKQMHDYYGLDSQAYETMKRPPLYADADGKKYRKYVCPVGHVLMRAEGEK